MIQSVARAFDILERVASRPDPAGVHELAREMGLKVTTLHGLMRTLAARGYLERDDRGRYGLGEGCRGLGMAFDSRDALARSAPKIMADLCAKARENVYLAVRRGRGIAFLRVARAPHVLSDNTERIEPDQVHATASGKLLMAYSPDGWIEDYVASGRLVRHTARTICRARDLRECLTKIREEGVASTDEELTEGIAALAVPVSSRGQVVAAIGTSLPKVRLDAESRTRLIGCLRVAAAALSRAIGGENGSKRSSRPNVRGDRG